MAPSEERMWEELLFDRNSEINPKYDLSEKQILTEINREKLPSFVQALKKPGYVDLNPYYQRRVVWDKEKQSRLIESFIINIPVPPIILYKKGYKSYEVIDGQQRIVTLRDFYENKLELFGLQLLPELNGLTYNKLPPLVKARLNRRSISSISFVAETNLSQEAFFLKKLVFERLNTGGTNLSRQEVRNLVYSSEFSQLLIELASNTIFAQAWNIPIENPDNLAVNRFYTNMEDAELVLRFFALRHVEDFHGDMKYFLDLYMFKSLQFSDMDRNTLRTTFIQTINLAYQVYQENLFKPFDITSETWRQKANISYYEAVMVGFSRYLEYCDVLLERKLNIVEETKNLFREDKSESLINEGINKADIQGRIKLFDDMLFRVITG